MPKTTFKNLLQKYNENQKIIDSPIAEEFSSEIDHLIANERQNALMHNIVSEVKYKLGEEKFSALIKKSMELREKKEPAFKADTSYSEYNEKINEIKTKTLLLDLNKPDAGIPKDWKVKAFFRQKNIRDDDALERYGYTKFINEAINDTPELNEYLSSRVKPFASLNTNLMGSYLIEALNDEELGIDLDTEIDDDGFAFDMPENEVKTKKVDDELINTLSNLPKFKGNAEIKKQLEEIDTAMATTDGEFQQQLYTVSREAEKQAEARAKKYGQNQYNKEYDEIYGKLPLNPNNPKKKFDVIKGGKEEAQKEFEGNDSFKLNNNIKEGIRLILNKFEEMGLSPLFEEQGFKVYGLEKVMEKRDELIRKSLEIKELQNRKKQEDAADDLEFNINNVKLDDPLNYQAQMEEKTEELLEIKKEYDKAIKDVDYLVDVCHKYFPNVKTINTNVDVTRNEMVPIKYRKDPIAISQINGLYYGYTLMKHAGTTIDEFIEHPEDTVKKSIDKTYDSKNLMPTGKEKTLKEFASKLVPICGGSDKGKLMVGNTAPYLRTFDGIAGLDPDKDNLENNQKSYLKGYKNYTNIIHHNFSDKILGDNKIKTYENLIAVGKPDLKLIEDRYYDPIARKFVEGNKFDVDKYINENEVTDLEIVANYKELLDAYNEVNKGASIDQEEFNEEINDITKAFAQTSIKYLQKHKIDPLKSNNPLHHMMRKALEDPGALIRDDMGIDRYTGEDSIDLTREISNYKRLDRYKDELALQKNNLRNLEKKVIKDELAFDKETKRLEKELNKKLDKLLDKDPTDKEYIIAAELRREFKNRLIQHSNELAQRCRNGEIPQGFFMNRSEQLMSGAPLGKLKFFGNTPTVSEDEFVAVKLEEKGPDFKATDNDINKLKLEYKEMVDRFKNEENTMIDREARKNNKAFPNIDIKNDILDIKDIDLIPADPDYIKYRDKALVNQMNPNDHDAVLDRLIDDSDFQEELSDDDSIIVDENNPKLIRDENDSMIIEDDNISVIDDPNNTSSRQRISIDLNGGKPSNDVKKSEFNNAPKKDMELEKEEQLPSK